MSDEPKAAQAAIMPADWAHLVPPIFARCVDPTVGRLSRPWRVGPHLYASDGRIAVRIPVPFTWDLPNPDRAFESVPDVFRGGHRPDSIAVPPVDPPCRECSGVRFLPARDCFACRGRGRNDARGCPCPNCDDEHPCEVCDGKGRLPAGECHDCGGFGVSNHLDGFRLEADCWIGRGYAALLHDFGATLHLASVPGQPLRFVAGDVEGRLMPFTPEACRDEEKCRETLEAAAPAAGR